MPWLDIGRNELPHEFSWRDRWVISKPMPWVVSFLYKRTVLCSPSHSTIYISWWLTWSQRHFSSVPRKGQEPLFLMFPTSGHEYWKCGWTRFISAFQAQLGSQQLCKDPGAGVHPLGQEPKEAIRYSVRKGVCSQSRRPEFDPSDPQGREKKLTPQSCPVPSTPAPQLIN